MGATDLLKTLAGHGMALQPKPGGGLLASGDPAAIAQHRGAIRKHKAGLLAILATEAQPPRLIVTVHPPAGAAMTVQAADAGHAEFLRCVNPPPRPAPAAVLCRDCRHAQPTCHPVLVDCQAEAPAPGNCGPFRWWGDDRHPCKQFDAREAR